MKTKLERTIDALKYFLNRQYVTVYIGDKYNQSIINVEDKQLEEMRSLLKELEELDKEAKKCGV